MKSRNPKSLSVEQYIKEITPPPAPKLEMELETIAGHLCAASRFLLARKFERWSKQLRDSARYMARQHTSRKRLLKLHPAKLAQN